MGPEDPAWMSELPTSVQVMINVAFLIVALIAAAKGYGPKRETADGETARPSADVQVIGGAFADRQAMQELTAAINRMTDFLEQQAQTKEAQEEAEMRSKMRELWDPLESTCRHASLSIL